MPTVEEEAANLAVNYLRDVITARDVVYTIKHHKTPAALAFALGKLLSIFEEMTHNTVENLLEEEELK